MLDVLAIAAFISLIVVIGAAIDHKARLRRSREITRPIYQVGNQTVYALAEWYAACERSREWSRSRRKRSK